MTDKLNAEEIVIVDEKRIENVTVEEDAESVEASAANGTAVGMAARVLLKDEVIDEVRIEEVIQARPRRKHRLLLPLLLALLLILLLPVIVLASSKATVTLVMDQHSLIETAVVSQHVGSFAITGQLSQPVPLSVVTAPGQHAHGSLTFHSALTNCQCAIVVTAGTVFRGTDGVSVMTDDAAILGPNCTVTVPAQALTSGSVGDIRAYDVQTMYSKGITAYNGSAFSGGTSDSSYSTMQQSSIDAVAHTLTAQLTPREQSALDTQAQQAGLTLLAKQCLSTINTSKGIVTVHMTCSAPAYNARVVKNQAIQQAFQQLGNQAETAFGSEYTRIRPVVDSTSLTILGNGSAATVEARATVEGQWTYQLLDGQKQEIAHMLAGKDMDDVTSLLKEQRGIRSFSIDHNSIIANLLPVLPDNIKVVTQA